MIFATDLESIGKMSVEIRKREEALIKARTYLNSIIDSMPSILIGVDIDLLIIQKTLQWIPLAVIDTISDYCRKIIHRYDFHT